MRGAYLKMNKEETRFFERKAFLIDFKSFTQVMQELLDDSTLEIEEDYPTLSMYSEGYDTIYEQDEIMERIGAHLKTNIIACCLYYDLEVIYFVSDKR